ncbi:Hypothetical predicted protein [Cloeon dipterum]|uniref:Protein kinase domain-containing protein n=1 Tax=Cloeon dipterum TaxID=197152 RepID=A0A8S1BVZ6_9INSE|nr:Hypothetical predicted protein [Cloeon dipterum]
MQHVVRCLPLFWAVVVGLPGPAARHQQLCLRTCTLWQRTGLSINATVTDAQGCQAEEQNSCLECVREQIRETDCTKMCSLPGATSCLGKCACLRNDEATSGSTVSAGQEPKLLCRDVEENATIVVLAFPSQKNVKTASVRIRQSDEWTNFQPPKIRPWIRLTNLTFSERYEVRLTSEDGDFARGFFSTQGRNHTPFEVTGVHISNYVSGADEALYANISWTPAADRPCKYSILVSGDDTDYYEPVKRGFELRKVTLGMNAAFVVVPKFGKKEGKPAVFRNQVPLCPETLTDPEGNVLPPNHVHCKPLPPTELCSIEHRVPEGIKITVTWTAAPQPQRAPLISSFKLFYFVNARYSNLGIVSIDATRKGNHLSWSTVIPANATEHGYTIKIKAESLSGTSEEKRIVRFINKTTSRFVSKNNCPPSGEFMNKVTEAVLFNNSSVQVVSAGAGVVIVAVCLFFIALVAHKKRANAKRRRRGMHFDSQLNNARSFGKRVNATTEKTSVLRLGHKLGEGHFGVVYKADMWQPEQKTWAVVAVKTLKSGSGDDVAKSQFAQESSLMKEVGRHPHVVSLLGEGELPHNDGYYMAVEFCERGDLLNLLRSHYLLMDEERAYVNDQQISNNLHMVSNQGYEKWSTVGGKTPLRAMDLMSFARQIALGMEYLASIRIVHRDLAARNVLVTSDMQLKVADFGLSRDVYEGSIYFKHQGPASLPLRWMALEAIERSMYTSASDVWSFGVLLWEVWTMGKEPYAGLRGAQVLEALKKGHRLARPEACPVDLYKIMLQCWSEIPLSRPTFSEFRSLVENMIEANSYLPVKENNRNIPSEEAPLLNEEAAKIDNVD